MVNSELRIVPACAFCKALVDGAQIRKCVGMGASMLFYGLTREQINPALESMGERPLKEHPDLRLWCRRCAERVLASRPDGRGRGGDCQLCRSRICAHPEDVELLAPPGCVVDGQPLCLNCRINVFFKEGRL